MQSSMREPSLPKPDNFYRKKNIFGKDLSSYRNLLLEAFTPEYLPLSGISNKCAE
jgi:hypothetical protein